MAAKPEITSSESPKGMTLVVKTVVRFAVGIIFMFGCYITVYGHLTPGGGFAGGTILACGYVILTLAFGKELALRKMSDMAASIIDNSCALIFVLVPIIGFAFGYFF
ncbi:MAG TPA: MnhB domain-containing protein, partial [Candidatus Bathyarchaeia archaeon]|nr:MnhB domain-containing protein [Candidatus Bathyarchaeia archaeon]